MVKLKRIIKHFEGEEINKRIIRKLRRIVMSRGEECSYSILYDDCEFSIKDLSHWDRAMVEQEHLILGADWFIMYVKRKREIEITDWVCVPNVKDKLVQTKEMLHAMKNIFLESRDFTMRASMKFDTSYQFFRSLLKHGYVEEYSNYVDTFNDSPSKLQEWVDNIVCFAQPFSEQLESNELKKNPEYKKYLYHDVVFGVTDKFIERYAKSLRK